MKRELSQSQDLKQLQRLILSPQMQQSLNLLQLPVLELSTVISEELEQNPLFEFTEQEYLSSFSPSFRDSKCANNREEEDFKTIIENSIAWEHSLFHQLMQQAQETFTHPEDLHLAEILIGNLNEKGFLASPLEEIAVFYEVSLEALVDVLDKIQQFEPPGICARDLKECFLLQLSAKGKNESLAYRIIDSHFDDVLHNRLPDIAKTLKRPISTIRKTLDDEIAKLALHPGAGQPEGHYQPISQTIVPDVLIFQRGEEWIIEVNEHAIPPFRMNHHYLKLLEDQSLPSDTRQYLEEKMQSGKTLLKNIQERHHTLYRIAEELFKIQRTFFVETDGNLQPLTMKAIAESIGLHESTIVRAVANKYLYCARGIFSLRAFFTHAYVSETGETVSSTTVKDLLQKLISAEDRTAPLSDEALSALIQSKGIPCARRTVAKYRQELGIGNTTQRKSHIASI